MNRLILNTKIILGIFLFILFSGIGSEVSAKAIKQPVKFNHRLHIQDVGLSCQECHSQVLTYNRASLPNIQFCAMCHDEGGDGQVTGNPGAQKVLEYIKKGQSIPWVRVYSMPDHVYFSHQRHVKIGGIECSVCHGRVDQATSPITREAVKHTMDSCMDCHSKSGASNDCVACHK